MLAGSKLRNSRGLEAEINRGAHVHRLGNLTLLTTSLNSKVSNAAWPTKRDAVRHHDTLLLNSRLLTGIGDSTWDEQAIDDRTSDLIDVLLQVWAVPPGHTGTVVDPHDKSQDWIEVQDLVAAGLLDPGTVLTSRPGKWVSREAVVLANGMLSIDGQVFSSPSGAGRHVRGSSTNGWTFWRLPDGRQLIDVRAAFQGEKPRTDGWTSTLPRTEWSEEDLAEYAAGSAALTLRLLDHIATERPDELLTGSDFASIHLTSRQVAGVTGAMARKVYNDYERSNPPVEFVEVDGHWHYRMTPATAATWKSVRQAMATEDEPS